MLEASPEPPSFSLPCRKEGAQVWGQESVSVALEASVLATPLFSGSGAVLPAGAASGQGWAALSMGRKHSDSGDKVAMSDVRRF